MQRNRKRARVERAQERQAAYDALTPQEKLDRTTERSFSGFGGSRRETARLLVNLADSKGSK